MFASLHSEDGLTGLADNRPAGSTRKYLDNFANAMMASPSAAGVYDFQPDGSVKVRQQEGMKFIVATVDSGYLNDKKVTPRTEAFLRKSAMIVATGAALGMSDQQILSTPQCRDAKTHDEYIAKRSKIEGGDSGVLALYVKNVNDFITKNENEPGLEARCAEAKSFIAASNTYLTTMPADAALADQQDMQAWVRYGPAGLHSETQSIETDQAKPAAMGMPIWETQATESDFSQAMDLTKSMLITPATPDDSASSKAVKDFFSDASMQPFLKMVDKIDKPESHALGDGFSFEGKETSEVLAQLKKMSQDDILKEANTVAKKILDDDFEKYMDNLHELTNEQPEFIRQFEAKFDKLNDDEKNKLKQDFAKELASKIGDKDKKGISTDMETFVNGYSIKPFQRITKIPLLMRELAKKLPDGSDAKVNICKALVRVADKVAVINEEKRNAEIDMQVKTALAAGQSDKKAASILSKNPDYVATLKDPNSSIEKKVKAMDGMLGDVKKPPKTLSDLKAQLNDSLSSKGDSVNAAERNAGLLRSQMLMQEKRKATEWMNPPKPARAAPVLGGSEAELNTNHGIDASNYSSTDLRWKDPIIGTYVSTAARDQPTNHGGMPSAPEISVVNDPNIKKPDYPPPLPPLPASMVADDNVAALQKFISKIEKKNGSLPPSLTRLNMELMADKPDNAKWEQASKWADNQAAQPSSGDRMLDRAAINPAAVVKEFIENTNQSAAVQQTMKDVKEEASKLNKSAENDSPAPITPHKP